MSQPTSSLARHLVAACYGYPVRPPDPRVTAKVKLALLDLLSCAFEAHDLPPSQQAIRLAGSGGPAPVFATSCRAAPADAAFINAVMAHGLVREDMHTGSVSHLGVVVLPVALAFAGSRTVRGRDLIAAAVCGYEAGAVIGKALMDGPAVRLHRPTGITGPIGAAMTGSVLTGLSEDQAVSALGLAANTVAGLNEWPHSGADDMFFQAGFAARNAVTAVELAGLGARGSESALDGPAGLFTVLGKADCAADVEAFAGDPEILAVFHKPAPACNYAQTPCQAAVIAAREASADPARVRAIEVQASAAALNYPGCNYSGPFSSTLQAKMSIQYGVAAAVATGEIAEANYRNLDDAAINNLASLTTVTEDGAFTAAYPGRQGARVTVTLDDGRSVTHELADLVPATPDEIRARFRRAASRALGGPAAKELEEVIDRLESLKDAGEIGALCLVSPERAALLS